jgi:2-phospho-L-lactate guanylyltransferase
MRRGAPVRWLAVVPIKPLPAAKTRLRGAVPDAVHPDLVLAMAQDTVAAALACPAIGQVRVVCDDPAVREALTRLGAQCVPDLPGAGLNAAVTFGATPARWTVALTADLPALRPEELDGALKEATEAAARAYVADAEGTGTVLLAAPPGVALAPRFGAGSAAAHQASGARRLDGDWPSLRRDVDTAADLDEARKLGLGTHTERMLYAITSSTR